MRVPNKSVVRYSYNNNHPNVTFHNVEGKLSCPIAPSSLCSNSTQTSQCLQYLSETTGHFCPSSVSPVLHYPTLPTPCSIPFFKALWSQQQHKTFHQLPQPTLTSPFFEDIITACLPHSFWLSNVILLIFYFLHVCVTSDTINFLNWGVVSDIPAPCAVMRTSTSPLIKAYGIEWHFRP